MRHLARIGIVIGLLFAAASAACAVEGPYEFLAKWGSKGTGDGQLNRLYGIVADSYDNIYVVDLLNSRIKE